MVLDVRRAVQHVVDLEEVVVTGGRDQGNAGSLELLAGIDAPFGDALGDELPEQRLLGVGVVLEALVFALGHDRGIETLVIGSASV